MESIKQKVKRNLKDGTFLKNVPLAVKNRILKFAPTLDIIYFLNKDRVRTKKYESSIPKISNNGKPYGNYFLDRRVQLDKNSIVYSLGILADIAFDSAVHEEVGCDIYMYDPTPITVKFMKTNESKNYFKYHPIGVWTENKTLRFYEPKFGGSASIVGEDASKCDYFDAKCETMLKIMKDNNHEYISVFKADIEGAALPVLHQMINNNIYPDQIVAEFERPRRGKDEIDQFFNDLSDLRTKLKNANYEEFLLPRDSVKYFSIEILFVNKTKIQ